MSHATTVFELVEPATKWSFDAFNFLMDSAVRSIVPLQNSIDTPLAAVRASPGAEFLHTPPSIGWTSLLAASISGDSSTLGLNIRLLLRAIEVIHLVVMLVNNFFDEVFCIEPILSGVCAATEVHFEEVYHIVGEVGRRKNPLLEKKSVFVDIFAVLDSVGRFWVGIVIKFIAELVYLGAIVWLWLSDVSLFIKFPIFIHNNIVEQLVADILFQLKQQLHLVGTALEDVLLAHGSVLLLEAQPRAPVLVVFAVIFVSSPRETPKFKLNSSFLQNGCI